MHVARRSARLLDDSEVVGLISVAVSNLFLQDKLEDSRNSTSMLSCMKKLSEDGDKKKKKTQGIATEIFDVKAKLMEVQKRLSAMA